MERVFDSYRVPAGTSVALGLLIPLCVRTVFHLVTIAVRRIIRPPDRAADYSQSRVVGGMHYPNDLFGGKLAGTAIAVAVQSRPEFKAAFELARRELRQYLGLVPRQ